MFSFSRYVYTTLSTLESFAKELMRVCLSFVLIGFTWLVSSTTQVWDLYAESQVTPRALLTDPYLQLPTADGAHVVWFTEWRGTLHRVVFGTDLDQVAMATSTKVSQTAEDAYSWVDLQNGKASSVAA